jgi:hypothetical protein
MFWAGALEVRADSLRAFSAHECFSISYQTFHVWLPSQGRYRGHQIHKSRISASPLGPLLSGEFLFARIEWFASQSII